MAKRKRSTSCWASRSEALLAACGFALLLTGCSGTSPEKPELVWGRRGVQPGDLVRPRAIAIDRNDRVYLVDFTARVQAFDADGRHLGHTWTTPDYRDGRPSGLSIDRDGHLLVSDSRSEEHTSEL